MLGSGRLLVRRLTVCDMPASEPRGLAVLVERAWSWLGTVLSQVLPLHARDRHTARPGRLRDPDEPARLRAGLLPARSAGPGRGTPASDDPRTAFSGTARGS